MVYIQWGLWGLDIRRLQAEGSDNGQEKQRLASAMNIGSVR